jgi:hypothetical protein
MVDSINPDNLVYLVLDIAEKLRMYIEISRMKCSFRCADFNH